MNWSLKSDEVLDQMVAEQKFDEKTLLKKADVYKALADPTRLKVLKLLEIEPMCLCELVSALNVPNSTMTHHIRLLERGELIYSEKVGRNTVFSLQEAVKHV
ncbi:metalloregulator ArsR/SmtB family transcription factor [Bacillus sp. WMMC1349]|uniref:ArsR/SmtB family transcription factor n=1 Tax=Bacillus sp. WMMC1349 TaxID=2736254 RepID=UPI0028155585|nr:metalloregulator ArsR/SmtB family transcription factor [Bacillus sp. WMMC1349]